MAAQEIVKKIYRPAYTVGQVYAAPYGSGGALVPIGNVLEMAIEHNEEVERQNDMTKLGGGVHAEVRRVTEVNFSATLADLNVVNLARAVLGTVAAQDADAVTGLKRTATLGALIPLDHINVSAVTITKPGANPATDPPVAVTAAGNWELRPEGIWIFEGATGITEGVKLTIGYSYADQVVIEHLTAKAAELQLRFAGLNEADQGKPCVVDLWRVSQGVTQQLAQLQQGFSNLEVSGSVLMDPTKVGAGISRYMRTTLV